MNIEITTSIDSHQKDNELLGQLSNQLNYYCGMCFIYPHKYNTNSTKILLILTAYY